MKQTIRQKTQDSKLSAYCGLKSTPDAYRAYKERKPKSTVTKQTYTKIVTTFFKVALKHLLDGGEVKLLNGIGVFKVVKRKRNLGNLKPNWKATKELWARDEESKENKKLVYHLNEHSKGFFYRFFWSRGRCKNIKMYGFKPVRAAQRGLAHAVMNDNKDYVG